MVGGENERGRGERRGREGAMKQVQGAGGLGLFVTSDGSLADADGITESSWETFRSGWTRRRHECLSLFLHLSAPLSSVPTSSVAGKSSSNSDSLLCQLLRS